MGCLVDIESDKDDDDKQQAAGQPQVGDIANFSEQVKKQAASNNNRQDNGGLESVVRQGAPLERRASVASHETDSPEGDEIFSEWHRIAILLDRFFFWLFLTVILLTTIICLGIFPNVNRTPPT